MSIIIKFLKGKMRSKKFIGFLGVVSAPILAIVTVACGQNTTSNAYAFMDIQQKMNLKQYTGSEDARSMRTWLKDQLASFNGELEVDEHDFTYELNNTRRLTLEGNDDWRKDNSWNDLKALIDSGDTTTPVTDIKGTNIVATLPASVETNNKVLAFGAHYDLNWNHSKTNGTGVHDNMSGVAALLKLAKRFANSPREYTLKFLLWDAEENGINGSAKYVEDLSVQEKDDHITYINLDSVAGGDYLYLGHGLDDGGIIGSNDAKDLYHQIKQSAQDIQAPLLVPHVQSDTKGDGSDFLPGEMYPASDHVPFNVAGIPIVGFETTNYEIDGQFGIDGYSQTTNENFWFPVEGTENADKGIKGGPFNNPLINVDGYERSAEEGWGKIWHMGGDTLESLEKHFPGRLEYQSTLVIDILTQFLNSY